MSRVDRSSQWAHLKIGDRVRCTDPESFMADVARKLTNRSGTVTRFQQFSGAPIIDFAAVGRRKPFKWVPPRPSDIEIIPEEFAHG